MNKYYSYSIRLILGLILLKLSYFFKVNLILGSHQAVLSGFSVVGPLVGLCGGGAFSIALFALKSLFSGFSSPWTLLSPVAWHLPSIFSSLYWVTNNRAIKLFLPLFCMALFIMHPIGLGAIEYSLFWLIPVAVYFIKTNNLFAHALASTFIAHAVGSVVWLYTFPMASEQWLSLIPVVIVERLLFAAGMVIVCSVVSMLQAWIANKTFSFDAFVKPVKSISH